LSEAFGPTTRRRCEGVAASVHTLLTRDRIFDPGAAGDRRPFHSRPGEDDLDFLQLIVSTEWSAALRSGARFLGLTINSLLCAAMARLIASNGSAPGLTNARNGRGLVRFTLPVGFRPRPGAVAPTTAGTAPRLEADTPLLGNLALPCELRLDPRPGAAAIAGSAQRAVQRFREQAGGHNLGRVEAILPAFRSPLPNGLGFAFAPAFLRSNVLFSNPGRLAFNPYAFADRGLSVVHYAGMSTILPPFIVSLFTPTLGGDSLRFEAIYCRSAFGSAANFEERFLRAFGRAVMDAAREMGIATPAGDIFEG
jgi:hypothetical protein